MSEGGGWEIKTISLQPETTREVSYHGKFRQAEIRLAPLSPVVFTRLLRPRVVFPRQIDHDSPVISRLQKLALTILLQSKYRKILLIAAGLIIVPLAYWFKLGAPNSPPDTAEYHFERLLSLHRYLYLPGNNSRSRFSVRALVWTLNGRPTLAEQMQEMEEHKKALLRLNFFEQRSFPLDSTNRVKDLTELYKRNLGKIWGCEMQDGQDNVWIIAHKEDMPAIARSIREVIAKTKR